MPRISRLFLAILLPLLLLAVPARADNPFGVMLWPNGEDIGTLLARARGLGIAWYRPPAVFADRWAINQPCPACVLYQRSGLNLVLTLRASGRDVGTRLPSAPPGDLAEYGRKVGAILQAWQPALLVVEDEENSPALFADPSPDFQGYAKELATACAAAHLRQTSCTNGGLASASVAALTWLDFLERGKTAEACDYARGAFYTDDDPQAGASFCKYKTVAELPAEFKARLLRGADRLLALYKTAPIDMVNFHWYIHDARALDQTIEFLGRVTGKPVACTEMGQWRWDADPTRVRPLLRAAFASQMKVVIWYSIDNANATSLFEPDGRLRPNGWEFQRQMRGR